MNKPLSDDNVPPKVSFWRSVKLVAWSFLGIRKNSEKERFGSGESVSRHHCGLDWCDVDGDWIDCVGELGCAELIRGGHLEEY